MSQTARARLPGGPRWQSGLSSLSKGVALAGDAPVLQVLREGGVVHTVTLTEHPLHVGRGPANGLRLTDPKVSTQHAILWVAQGSVWARDLGSRNGTFLNGTRVTGPVQLSDGDVLRLGMSAELRLDYEEPEDTAVSHGWVLEDVANKLAFPLHLERLYVGSGPDCHVQVPEAPTRAATLTVHANGEVWVGTEEDEFQLEPEQTFTVAGRSFRLTEASAPMAPTIDAGARAHYPYRLYATLNGPGGPEAVLENTDTGARYRVDSVNRAVLLFILARQLTNDRAADLYEDDAGWTSDDDIIVGIWGRNAPAGNSLHVLVHRLRQQLEKAGFDPWFIEKRRRALRARLREVVVS